MTILVAGSTGFTGKALVKRLLENGHEIVVLDYKEDLKTEELRDLGPEVVIGSVLDKDLVRGCVRCGGPQVHRVLAWASEDSLIGCR